MTRQIKVFLIRHGETVDNVAQVYAGSRDSELTNHGYQQATKLGLHFKALDLSFTHIFSSHLQRAAKTAGLIRDAQATAVAEPDSASEVPDVVQLPTLMEQDFGYYEGKKFHERAADSKLTGKEHHRQEHKDTAGFVDVESKDSLAQRADTFLDGHLLPLLEESISSTNYVVAVVSHGIMLSNLWKRLLLRLPPKSVAFSPKLVVTERNSLEHLGGWSNTGYLGLHMTRVEAPGNPSRGSKGNTGVTVANLPPSHGQKKPSSSTDGPSQDIPDTSTQSAEVPTPLSPCKVAYGWTTVIQTINGKDHLLGLKRTGGGVGSSRHDSSQKNIESFFKRGKMV
ncbi:histidine phosphatase superfamily [Massariosphaeria phaeospora]|uniref:Histidine phosphatase superfamily n=1 Tax=Massariosphaeria phaeospora TaxID=100035 RepID=A0A7C8M306_9PLEO|nr:histidine phosphatase superfamily [Massariosphaeria phaeospora]